MRYKLPHEAPTYEPVEIERDNYLFWSEVEEVGYFEPNFGQNRGFANVRYCLGVENNHNFMTRDGLVANCDDVLYTFECWEVLTKALQHFNLGDQYAFQMRLFLPVLKMMLRGVNIDQRFKNWLNGVLLRQMQSRAEWLEKSVGHELNPDNHDQIKRLLYKDFRAPAQRDKKTRQLTSNDEALDKIKEKQPFLRPLCQTIQESRSLRVFRSTFAEAPLSEDGRMRSSVNIAGTETLRFSSSRDAFGSGCNMQTLPKGNELFKFLKDMTDNTKVELDEANMVARHPKYGEAVLDESQPDDVVSTVRKWIKEDEKEGAA